MTEFDELQKKMESENKINLSTGEENLLGENTPIKPSPLILDPEEDDAILLEEQIVEEIDEIEPIAIPEKPAPASSAFEEKQVFTPPKPSAQNETPTWNTTPIPEGPAMPPPIGINMSPQNPNPYGAPAQAPQNPNPYGAPPQAPQPSNSYGAPPRAPQPQNSYRVPQGPPVGQPMVNNFAGYQDPNQRWIEEKNKTSKSLGLSSVILDVIAFFSIFGSPFFGGLLFFIALILGIMGLAKLPKGKYPNGSSIASSDAKTLSIVGVVISALFFCFLLLVLFLAIASASYYYW